MNDGYRALFVRSLLALGGGLVLVVVCYFWIDRPVAHFVADRGFNEIILFKWLTYPPPIVEKWAPLAFVVWAIARARGPVPRLLTVLAVSCLALIVADEFRESLGAACGRYWPATWHDNNPSLLGTGHAYGFQWFAGGGDNGDLGSFPSGHSARVLGLATVWWIAYPRARIALGLVCLPMLASLILMDYHFVGDVIAGGTIGGIVGAYAAQLALLKPGGAAAA